MIEPLSLVTALLLGLFGSSHCLVMCGGIAAAIGQTSPAGRLPATVLAFNGGRIVSYALLGTAVAIAGMWLGSLHQTLMLVLRLIAAGLLILMGLYIGRWAFWLNQLERLGQGLWQRLQPWTKSLMMQTHPGRRFLLGMLWGLLPCGLIYSTLSWVAANGDPLLGAATMATFGLGTLPALISGSLASRTLGQLLSHRWSRSIAAVMLIAYGFYTGWQAWLMG